MGILQLQCTGNLSGLLKTCVNIDPSSLSRSLSKNVCGLLRYIHAQNES